MQNLSSSPNDTFYQLDSATRAGFGKKRIMTGLSRMYMPKSISFSITGDIDDGQQREFVNGLMNWQSFIHISSINEPAIMNPDSMNINRLNTPYADKIYLMDKVQEDKSVRLVIRYAEVPVSVGKDYYVSGLTDFMISNYYKEVMGSYLKDVEDKITHFSTYSYYNEGKKIYVLVVGAEPSSLGVVYDKVLLALQGLNQLQLSKSQLFTISKGYYYRDMVSNETPAQKEKLIQMMITNNLTNELLSNESKYLKKVKASALVAYWKNYYKPEDLKIMVIGDAASVNKQLESKGRTIQYIDRSGNVQIFGL
jgi:hypothetical protein